MKALIILLLPILLTSCLENSPNFLEPQPANTKNLETFPKKLRGDYSMNEKENLSISESMIIQWGVENIGLSLTEVDSNNELVINNDTLYYIDDGSKIPIEIRNDSLFGSLEWQDTAFAISEINILRKINKTLILNEFTKDSGWKVVRMEFDKIGRFEIALINKRKETDILKSYTPLLDVEIKNDTIVDYRLKPTKKEFKNMLLSKDLFTDKKEYLKINEKVSDNK